MQPYGVSHARTMQARTGVVLGPRHLYNQSRGLPAGYHYSVVLRTKRPPNWPQGGPHAMAHRHKGHAVRHCHASMHLQMAMGYNCLFAHICRFCLWAGHEDLLENCANFPPTFSVEARCSEILTSLISVDYWPHSESHTCTCVAESCIFYKDLGL